MGPFGACALEQRGNICTFADFKVGPLIPLVHEATGNDFGEA